MSSKYIVFFVNIRNISTKILPYNNIRYVGVKTILNYDLLGRYVSKVDFFTS